MTPCSRSSPTPAAGTTRSGAPARRRATPFATATTRSRCTAAATASCSRRLARGIPLSKRDMDREHQFLHERPGHPRRGPHLRRRHLRRREIRRDSRGDRRAMPHFELPSANNPCNAYNPTPIPVLVWEPGKLTRRCSQRSWSRTAARSLAASFARSATWASPVVAVHSDADAFARHVREADEAVCVGGAAPAESYLRGDRILGAARDTGAEAIHPGYGFLSERAEFADACERAGIRFIGPTPRADPRVRAEAPRARDRRDARRPSPARHAPAAERRGRGGACGRDWLPGHPEEHRGRRRHRPARLPRARASSPMPSSRSNASGGRTSESPARTSRSSSSAPGTSRSRSSATASARSSSSASGTARCSAATRR